MSYFEFIMVMLSIIVGLGVTELLTNVARQLKAGKSCKPYWVQTLVVVTILIALLQQWWESWGLQSVDNWNFLIVLMLLAGPIGLFLIAHLLYPETIENSDLKKHYYSICQRTWTIGAIVVVVASLFRPISFGDPLLDWDNLVSSILLIMFLTLIIFNNKRLNEILVPVLLIAVLLDILVFNIAI